LTPWLSERSRAWYRDRPYVVGANFIPSTAINQLEMWQAETFDPVTIERELRWARQLGMNLMRVYLHDLLWEQDREGFCRRIDQYLGISTKLGIQTMFVLFDDCGKDTFAVGRQPEPIPFTHNSGWVKSPGLKIVNDSHQWARLEEYVTGLLTRFKDDARIALWDLYNEPGNGSPENAPTGPTMQGKRSLPLLQQVFTWARSVDGVTQPLTAGVWNFTAEFTALCEFSLTNSDIVTFHCYGPPQDLEILIRKLQAHGRPLICTEYMARSTGSTFAECLPLLQKYNIGAVNWGLVSGKTQTIYPWFWTREKGPPDVLFHDVFASDGTFLYPAEEHVIKRATGRCGRAGDQTSVSCR